MAKSLITGFSRGVKGVTQTQRARHRWLDLVMVVKARAANSHGTLKMIVRIRARMHRGSPMAQVRQAETIACPSQAVVACDQRQHASFCPGIGCQQQLHT
jgi:hypothetical protein